MMTTNWNQLRENRESALLRGSLATGSPQSYSLEEMKAISEGMDASTAEIDAALRADLEVDAALRPAAHNGVARQGKSR